MEKITKYLFIKKDKKKEHLLFFFDEKCYIYELNSMGYFIWNNIDKFDSVEQFVLHLQSVIADQIPFEILLEDVNAFIICLADEGFVKLEDNDGRNK